MKKIILLGLIVILCLSLTSCFPGDKTIDDEPAGFFNGVIHGWIAPLSLILSFFKDNITMYEVHNTGFWYELGFYMAIISGFGGLSFSRKKRNED